MDSIIPTTTGPVLAHELTPGSLIADGSGGHTLVVQIEVGGPRASHTSYRIVTAHRELEVNATQNILVVEQDEVPYPKRSGQLQRIGRLGWRTGREIHPGMIVVCANAYYPESTQIGVDLARFIGAYCGDGWIRTGFVNPNGYALGLAIGAKNDPHTMTYLRLCQRLFPHVLWKNNAKGAFGLSATSSYVTTIIRGLGLDKPSTTRRIPAFAFNLVRGEKLALLSGYIDADGSISVGGAAGLGSRSVGLITDLRELALGCGLEVTLARADWVENEWGAGYFYRASLTPLASTQLEIWHDKKRELVKSNLRRVRGQGLRSQALGYLKLPAGHLAERVRKVERRTHETIRIETNNADGSFIASGVIVASDPKGLGLAHRYRRTKSTVGKFVKKADRASIVDSSKLANS